MFPWAFDEDKGTENGDGVGYGVGYGDGYSDGDFLWEVLSRRNIASKTQFGRFRNSARSNVTNVPRVSGSKYHVGISTLYNELLHRQAQNVVVLDPAMVRVYTRPRHLNAPRNEAETSKRQLPKYTTLTSHISLWNFSCRVYAKSYSGVFAAP